MNPDPTPPARTPAEPRAGEGADVEAMHAAIMREHAEPREGYEPVSLWLIAFIGALLFWAGLYFQKYSANFNATILDTRYPTEIRATTARAPASPELLGQRTFNATCVACHQAHGQGVPGQFPPLAGSEWVLAENPGRMIRVILHGLQGPLLAGGQQFNNSMPPWRETLSDQQIAAVATFVRNQWGNRAPPVTPEQVAAIRAETRQRTQPFTADELNSL